MNLLEWFKGYWVREGDSVISDILVIVIAFILFNVIGTFILWLLKKAGLWIKEFCISLPARIKKFKADRAYKKTIKQIERLEIPIPENFLLFKTPEKNPELSKIFQMIEDEIIEAPPHLKLAKLAKGLELGEFDMKLNLQNMPTFDPSKYIKK